MERAGLDEQRLTAMARALGVLLRPGDVVLLEGPMGAGKTTFTRALAHGLGVARPDRVRSPTYTLCMRHPGPRPLAHVDLFRLAAGDEDSPGAGTMGAAAFEALDLDGLLDGVEARQGLSVGLPVVLVVEWADLWADPPPAHLRVRLDLEPGPEPRRRLVAEAVGERPGAVLTAWEAEIGTRPTA